MQVLFAKSIKNTECIKTDQVIAYYYLFLLINMQVACYYCIVGRRWSFFKLFYKLMGRLICENALDLLRSSCVLYVKFLFV